MSLNVQEAVRELTGSIKNRTLVPFCGAGISMGSGLPSAQEFIENFDLGGLSWSQATTIIRTDPNMKHKFKAMFGIDGLVPSEQHRLLASLDAPCYVTTNYDLLLEEALKDLYGYKNRIGILRKTEELSNIYKYRNLVIKLHGDVQTYENLVFDSRDYMSRWRSPSHIDAFVFNLFSTHTILFVGYSLNDPHVIESIQEALEYGSANLPAKYIIVDKLDSQYNKYLETINVRPILLETYNDDLEGSVCDFLYRLWERRGTNPHTKLQEKEKHTTAERLKMAISFRQNNDLGEAKHVLKDMSLNDIEQLEQIRLVDSFLWLTVSIYDKSEDWHALLALDQDKIAIIFKKLKESVPDQIYRSLRTSYQASMAIACLRMGDYEQALKRSEESIDWTCSDSADKSLHIIYANAFVTHALCHLFLWRTKKRDNKSLDISDINLNKAWEILETHGKDSHFLGRYHGARVFVKMAQHETSGSTHLDIVQIKQLLEHHAKLAHTPQKFRTNFGRIAGQYCEAFCRYWLAIKKFDESKENLKNLEVLLNQLNEKVTEPQFVAITKIYKLKTVAENDLGLNLKNWKFKDNEIDTIYRNFPPKIRENITSISDDQWLSLPLN